MGGGGGGKEGLAKVYLVGMLEILISCFIKSWGGIVSGIYGCGKGVGGYL